MGEKKAEEAASLCDSCAKTQDNGTPCGIMLSGDVVGRCSVHEKDQRKHDGLVKKYGSKSEPEAKAE